MNERSRVKIKLLLLLFAFALVLRPVLVSLHNSALGGHLSAADTRFASGEDPSALSADQQALKKIAKQIPRAKRCLASSLNQVCFLVSGTPLRSPDILPTPSPARILNLRI